jgi:hypothetical protein
VERNFDRSQCPPELVRRSAARWPYDKSQRPKSATLLAKNEERRTKNEERRTKNEVSLFVIRYSLFLLVHLVQAPIDLFDSLRDLIFPNLVRRRFQLTLQFGFGKAE